jgi:hypothetical protein
MGNNLYHLDQTFLAKTLLQIHCTENLNKGHAVSFLGIQKSDLLYSQLIISNL